MGCIVEEEAHVWQLGPPKALTAGAPAVRDRSGFQGVKCK